jgi:hypothetical protein
MSQFFSIVAAWARIQWAKFRGYRILTTMKESTIRYDHCLKCPAFDGFQCGDCGCLAMAKVMITTEECPRKKWHRVWEKR